MRVPLPAPEGPEMTMSLAIAAPRGRRRSVAQHIEQFFALAWSEPVHSFGRTHAAPFEELVGLDPPILWYGQHQIENLGGVNTLRGIDQHLTNGNIPVTQPFFEPGSLGTDVVSPSQSFHPLLTAALGRLWDYARRMVHRSTLYACRGGTQPRFARFLEPTI